MITTVQGALTAIAAAIRRKAKVETTMTLEEMPGFIDSIVTEKPIEKIPCVNGQYVCSYNKQELLQYLDMTTNTNCTQLFANCDQLTDVILNECDFSNGLITTFNSMCVNCTDLVNVRLALNLAKTVDLRSMFSGCSNLESIDFAGSSGGMSLNYAYGTQSMFNNCRKLRKVWLPKEWLDLPASAMKYGLLYGCGADEAPTVYTDAEDDLPDWGTFWKYYSLTDRVNVVYGADHAAFEDA